MAIAIRPATAGDLDWLVGQLRAFSRFCGTKLPAFGDEAHVRAGLENFIASHLLLIAERDETERLGFLGALGIPHPFNPEIKLLTEMFWWVDEERRGSRAAPMLLDAYVEWGRANADWVTMALEHHSPVSEKHLLKRGFKLRERSYLLEVA